MTFSKLITFCFLAITILLSSCKKDNIDDFPTSLDSRLEEALKSTSNGVGNSFYVLPKSDDFSSIPQDPKKPADLSKSCLGKIALPRNRNWYHSYE